MKKVLLFLTAFLFIFTSIVSFSTNVFAEENIDSSSTGITYEDYLKLIDDDSIDKSISFEELKEFEKASKELEKILEDDSNFTTMRMSDSFSLQPGDIIVTNATVSSGIIGHAAIALSSDEILHIPGTGSKVECISLDKFKRKYKDGWAKVSRPNNYNTGCDAARWADRTYRNSNAKYRITTDLTTTNETYCSKIVWQAYYYGAGSSHSVSFGFIMPYDVVNHVEKTMGHYCSYMGDL